MTEADWPVVRDQTLALAETVSQTRYVACHFPADLAPIRVDEVAFERCEFAASDLAGEWLDCRFTGCDFSNTDWSKSQLYRNHWQDCRLLVLAFTAAHLKACRLTGCQADYAILAEATLDSVRLVDCGLAESAWQAVTVQHGLRLKDCRLREADFTDVKLAGVDLRGSACPGVRVTPRLLPGLRIDRQGAADLMANLGVQVD